MVTRVLKDNKVPRTSAGTRAAEAPCRDAGSAAGFLGEGQAGLCERLGACLYQRGLNRRNFSKRKRENRGTQQLFRELSAVAAASGALPPQPLDCEHRISSPSTHLRPAWPAPRLADWAPTVEVPAGHSHPTLGVGTHPVQWLAVPPTGPQLRSTPTPQAHSCRSPPQPDKLPGCQQGTTPKSTFSEQLLPSPSAQSPAGPTGSLGGRQNARQRGPAGLRETAVPGKT